MQLNLAKREFTYVNKWLANKQINQKLSNYFWKNDHMPDTQITQTPKFRYAQYMGNHSKNIFWPLKYQNPNCTLYQNNDRDTWPHLLSTCEHLYFKGLRITRHNKAIHLITQTLQAKKCPRFFTLTNAGNLNNQPLDQIVLEWLLTRTCPQRICQCQAKLRPNILCIIGAPNQTQTPITPSPKYTVQLIEFTYCHNRFQEQALTHKPTKYDPLFSTIQNKGWKTNPSITITAGVRGAIHEHSIDQLNKMKISKANIKTLMKSIHQNAIKYLAYLVLNTRKLNNRQLPVPPP